MTEAFSIRKYLRDQNFPFCAGCGLFNIMHSFLKAVYESGSSDLKANFMATVNGFLLNQLQGVETKLKNGDHVTLMPVVSGG